MNAQLPAYFYERNPWAGFYCVGHALVLWFGCGWLASVLYQWHGLTLAVRLPLIAILVLVSGMGLFYATTLSHEGFHGNLHPNRHASMLMGMTASATVPLYLSVGYTLIHWPHHIYTNTAKDPDYAAYSRYDGFLSRIAFGPPSSGLMFLRNTLALLVRGPSVELRHYPFSLRAARRFAVVNLALSLTFLALHVLVAVTYPTVFVFTLLLPMVVAGAYLGMVPFIDHAATRLGRGEDARSYTARLFTLLLVGTNYHREHHLYPNVPSFKLPRLHRYLKDTGQMPPTSVVEPSFLAALRIGATGQLARAPIDA